MSKSSPKPVFVTASQLRPPQATRHLGFEFLPGAPHPYFRCRALRDDTIHHFNLGCSHGAPSLKGRVPIPLHSADGTLIGYAARLPGENARRSKYRFLGQGEDEPFNLHRVLAERVSLPVVITTAPFDVFHLWQCGYETVVGLFTLTVPDRVLNRILLHLPSERFILLFDETDAGREIRSDLVDRLSPFAWVRAIQFADEGRTVESLTSQEVKEHL